MTERTLTEIERIEELILDFVRDQLVGDDVEQIGLEDNLLLAGLIDSVGIVRLIAHVSAELRVTIPPGDLIPDNFRTIRIMAAYLHGLPRG